MHVFNESFEESFSSTALDEPSHINALTHSRTHTLTHSHIHTLTHSHTHTEIRRETKRQQKHTKCIMFLSNVKTFFNICVCIAKRQTQFALVNNGPNA